MDQDTCNYALYSLVDPACTVCEPSPIPLAKAVKTETEIKAMKECHIRDAVALTNYFSWLEKEIGAGKSINEWQGAQELENFRRLSFSSSIFSSHVNIYRQQENYVSPSFSTISSVGANAAIIHYCPTKSKCATITDQEIYLCDSGGQYRDGGTTDLTRTFHFGEPTEEQIQMYTLVLKVRENSSTCPTSIIICLS